MQPARAGRPISILAVSDVVEEALYRPSVRACYGHVDLIVSCGDLPSDYLDYLMSTLDVPLLGVRGNHEHGLDEPGGGRWRGLADAATGWWPDDRRRLATESAGGRPPPAAGAVDLHARTAPAAGLLFAGLEGSQRYNRGACQYTEFEMWLQILRLVPGLLTNKLRFGRYLDVLVTHAPPRGIHDRPDRCHRGFAAVRTFLRLFQPRYHLHGHTHVYDRQTATRTQFGATLVVNVYGHREIRVEAPAAVRAAPSAAGAR